MPPITAAQILITQGKDLIVNGSFILPPSNVFIILVRDFYKYRFLLTVKAPINVGL